MLNHQPRELITPTHASRESKQVDYTHYRFESYMSKQRWSSLWHQLDEVLKLQPRKVLEIGPGAGVFKGTAALFGLMVETLDVDPQLQPDHVASATALPFADASYDVVCAFQMLEHLPYQKALRALAEMARVSRGPIVVSLPDCEAVWRYRVSLPMCRAFDFLVKKPRLRRRTMVTQDGQHFWEINLPSYSLERVASDISKYATILRTYRVLENPYHRFFVLKSIRS